MKRMIFLSMIWLFIPISCCIGQDSLAVNPPDAVVRKSEPSRHQYGSTLSMGCMMGGGALIGADLEISVINRFSLQTGIGLNSFGLGLNYHLRPRLNSSFISIQYMYQGFVEHYASYLGPMFVFRLKKVFQAGIGVGFVLEEGPESKLDGIPAVLTYQIGIYF